MAMPQRVGRGEAADSRNGNGVWGSFYLPVFEAGYLQVFEAGYLFAFEGGVVV